MRKLECKGRMQAICCCFKGFLLFSFLAVGNLLHLDYIGGLKTRGERERERRDKIGFVEILSDKSAR